ncbi:MAG: Na+/H+ antiporter NhaA [Megasphaera sp.]|jgi:NhaA family Na+:H+ antiporter|nr:Na+/H+ antiporter NhaA [Megasphaera sp.]MCH4188019.1 Na+/H+ antiporter NhaA [Megasphaera sp.]MCH4217109.1 Na+/H+ antiporter NhaA [Megasphaera sp.]
MVKKSVEVLSRHIQRLTAAFQYFFKSESSSSLLLLACAVLAMLLANSPWSGNYEGLLHHYISCGFLSMSLLHWINDGLMALFFFVIGMEIKREFLFGELKTPSAMALPVAAAIGGMVVPALLYTLFNWGRPSISGWGIPMATDIAFSLGILAIVAKKVPRGVAVFLTALAIVDDLGGILVIALFYSSELHLTALAAGAVIFIVLQVCCRRKVTAAGVYILLGLSLWYAFLQGGIHPTIAGVLLGFSIPAGNGDGDDSLLDKMEHILTPWSAYIVMPVFALGNAGIMLDAGSLTGMASPIGLGIIAGLFLGKPMGIFGAVYGMYRFGLVTLPKGARLAQFFGAAILGGIGFTMSLFIASLAFTDAASLMTAKMSIVCASLLSGAAGAVLFTILGRQKGNV